MAARSARGALGLARVIFIPASSPPHKGDLALAGSRHRLNMVRLSVKGKPGFSVSSIEMRRPGPSYTVDTVKQIAAKFPGRPLVFIVGADTVPEIGTWSRYRQLLKRVQFAVVPRRGHRPKAPAGYGDRFILLKTPSLDVSSSRIRRRIRMGKPVSGRHLPRPVASYIRRAGLYGSQTGARTGGRRR